MTDSQWIDKIELPDGNVYTVYPNQEGNSGKFLTTDGENASWGHDATKMELDYSNAVVQPVTYNQITNCILEAPNGVATYSDSTVTIKSGLKLLIPNGKNDDGTLNNIEYTLDQDYTRTLSSSELSMTDTWDIVFVRNLESGTTQHIRMNKYFMQNQTPPIGSSTGWYPYWYQPSTNKFYRGDSTNNTWVDITGEAVFIGIMKNVSGTVDFTPNSSVDLLTQSDKSIISSWGMPSAKYISLSVGSSGTYFIAPANGWVDVQLAVGGSEGYLRINAGPSSVATSSTTNQLLCCLAPVRKGCKYQILYSNTTSSGVTSPHRFWYVEGEC